MGNDLKNKIVATVAESLFLERVNGLIKDCRKTGIVEMLLYHIKRRQLGLFRSHSTRNKPRRDGFRHLFLGCCSLAPGLN